MVCNPPYLPSFPNFHELPLDSTVFGTDLLENVIAAANSRARNAFISFSNLALPEKEDVEKRTGAVLKEIGEPHRIPFRIAYLYDRHDYIKKLIEERGLEYFPGKPYPLWHTVQTYQITHPASRHPSNLPDIDIKQS